MTHHGSDEPQKLETAPKAALVLIVEDNSAMRGCLVSLLETKYRVESAAEGREAFEKALALRPDLILSDVMLPRMSGDQLLRALRAHPETENIPVVLLTGSEDVDLRLRLLREGVQEFMTKPFSPEELLARVARLIDEHTKNEASLREAYRLLRAVTDGINDAVYVKDSSGRYLMMNAAGARYLGRTMEDVIGRDDRALFSAERAERIIEDDRQVKRDGEARTYEEESNADGITRTFHTTKAPYRDSDGKIIGVLGISRDITERKRAYEETREHRELLRVTLASIGDAVIATNTTGQIIFMNAVAAKLTGWKQDEVKGRSIAEVFHVISEDGRKSVETPVTSVLREGRVIPGIPTRTVLISRDGSERPIDNNAAPILDEHGALHGAVLVFHDVSEQRSLEQGLRNRADNLAESHKRKDEFLAMLGHELRNPLAPIRNALHIMRLRAPNAAGMKDVQDILERQVAHLNRLVDDLLDVSRVTRGRISLKRERVDFAQIVYAGVCDRQSELDAAGLTLELDVPETPVWMSGDAIRLSQILDNILQNAVKFTDRGGNVTVQLVDDRERGEAILSVQDTGIGIEPEMIPKLFDAFTQADRSLDRSRGGLGLGLALVKGLVELHGGKVSIRSEGPGKGSEITIAVPREGEPPALLEKPLAAAPTLRNLRILVVEDNQDAARSLQMLLEFLGCDVIVTHSGLTALKVAYETHPDVVLCDIGLPGMDGFAVANALRSNPATANIRLVAITGYGQESDRRKVLQAGFDEHLVKPVDPQRLLGQLGVSIH